MPILMPRLLGKISSSTRKLNNGDLIINDVEIRGARAEDDVRSVEISRVVELERNFVETRLTLIRGNRSKRRLWGLKLLVQQRILASRAFSSNGRL